jgi:lipoprotein-anchoring transpeptidase ErfK/SrfK
MQARSGLAGRIPLLLMLALATSLLVTAGCAPKPAPTLTTAVADQSRDVPLDQPLEVATSGATLDSVVLERLDAAQPAPSFEVSGTQARLTGPLEPDARYRLVAQAHSISEAARAPWQEAVRTDLSLQREFSTVRSPVLVEPSQSVLLQRDKPLDLRFSQALQDARLVDAPSGAKGLILGDDPRVFRVEFSDLAPGEEMRLTVANGRARNGAPGTPQTLSVRTPDPVELMAINGAQPGDRVVVPPSAAVALEWNAPVTSLLYRVADKTERWSGTPTSRLDLPIRLDQGQSSTIEILDATAVEGGWLSSPRTLDLAAPAPLQLAAVWPNDGATKVTPKADPHFRFSEPVAAREVVESMISFDPPVPGRWDWLGPDRVRFVPEESFPAESQVKMLVQGGPNGIRGASGAYLPENVSTSFQTGKQKTIRVWLGRQRLALLEDDQEIWSAPVATGVRGAETPLGNYEVQYKMPVARFRGVNPNGSRYDIPDVHWVLAFYEDYTIHGAYWRRVFGAPGSNGCISLTDPNAKVVFDFADVGTRVEVLR